ncbi:hypothetical protein IQ264_07140 [Phormidium sp. LEGE 05292]|uniref:hypothetical protein n=1 Tax=[Phormidium] sp. LEGE 05292 TaxID=767427 RepID=UPI00187E008F|nr:hypothetical protein [Phormidium sp. LEGE 05292]MBE9225205.1 hypothetical protein [Phormidium sp. LEGE 05292]
MKISGTTLRATMELISQAEKLRYQKQLAAEQKKTIIIKAEGGQLLKSKYK